MPVMKYSNRCSPSRYCSKAMMLLFSDMGYGSLKSPACSCVSIRLPASWKNHRGAFDDFYRSILSVKSVINSECFSDIGKWIVAVAQLVGGGDDIQDSAMNVCSDALCDIG